MNNLQERAIAQYKANKEAAEANRRHATLTANLTQIDWVTRWLREAFAITPTMTQRASETETMRIVHLIVEDMLVRVALAHVFVSGGGTKQDNDFVLQVLTKFDPDRTIYATTWSESIKSLTQLGSFLARFGVDRLPDPSTIAGAWRSVAMKDT